MKAEFFILGILHRGDFHPYEMKRRLNNALVECYTDIDVGTLYYAVRQLVNPAISHRKRGRRLRAGENARFTESHLRAEGGFSSFCSSDFRNKEPWRKPFIPLCSFSISPSFQL